MYQLANCGIPVVRCITLPGIIRCDKIWSLELVTVISCKSLMTLSIQGKKNLIKSTFHVLYPFLIIIKGFSVLEKVKMQIM